MKCRVNWDRHVWKYHLLEGEIVELSPEDYDYLIHESDGCLTLVPDDTPVTPVVDDPEADGRDSDAPITGDDETLLDQATVDRALTAPPGDRMMNRRRIRRHLDRDGDPEGGSTGPMTGSDLGARKG